MYMALKHTHYLVVFLSAALLTLQFCAVIYNLKIKDAKWLKILPHVVYTLILLTALGLLGTLKINPFEQAWAAQKVLGFVFYVVLATFALKFARNNLMRTLGYFGAMAWFLITINMAISKTPIF